MSYSFTYDLSKLPQALFKEIVNFSYEEKLHKKLDIMARSLVKKIRDRKNYWFVTL